MSELTQALTLIAQKMIEPRHLGQPIATVFATILVETARELDNDGEPLPPGVVSINKRKPDATSLKA